MNDLENLPAWIQRYTTLFSTTHPDDLGNHLLGWIDCAIALMSIESRRGAA